MAGRNFTDTLFRHHPGVDKKTDISDQRIQNLWARIAPTGGVTFFYRYTSKVDGKRKRVTIGGYPGVSVKEARATATEWNAWLMKIVPGMSGEELRKLDPWASRNAQQEAVVKAAEERKQAQTLRDAWDRYTKLVKPQTKKWSATQNIWDTHWSRFAARPIDELTSDEIEDYLIDVRDGTVKGRSGRPAPYAANRAHDLIKAIFSKGAKRSVKGRDNPAAFPKVAKTKPRARVPSVVEVAKIWVATEDMTEAQRNVVRFVILTLKRRAETALALLGDVDRDAMLWRIPPENSKIEIEEFVPLSDRALALLPAKGKKTAPCFPGRDTGTLFPDTVSKYWNKACELAKVEDFHLHDIRTAGASYLGAIHASAVVSRVLGHKPRGGGAAIHHYLMIEEEDPRVREAKRRALEDWESAVMAAVSDVDGSWLDVS